MHTLAWSIFMEQQPSKAGQQSGTPPRLEKLGNVWQAFQQGEDTTFSSSVRHLATFFVADLPLKKALEFPILSNISTSCMDLV
jgi:hypothetical protein